MNIDVVVSGGGTMGQTDAVRTAIAKGIDGITRFDLATLEEQTILPGPTEFTYQLSFVAPNMWVRQAGSGLTAARIKLNGAPVKPLRQSAVDIVWTVPADMAPGPAEMEAAQPGSPFQPHLRMLEVQRAAPVFITEADAGIVVYPTFALPLIFHANSGEAVSFDNPAHPGESVKVVMTGLNDHAQEIKWTLWRSDNPVFESSEPYAGQPHWTVVRLKLPGSLPEGLCFLFAEYGRAQGGALIITSDR